METKQALDALSALAQETRLAIFRLLVETGPVGLAAGHICEQLSLSAPTLSFHLAHLARTGLIRSRREGRHIYYATDFAQMNALVDYLTENCCSGAACAPAACTPAALTAVSSRPSSRRATAKV